MSAPTKTLPVEQLDCGCSVEIESHGGKRVVGKCEEAEALFRQTKEAGRASFGRAAKGGAKTALVREFARRRAAFHEHVFGRAL